MTRGQTTANVLPGRADGQTGPLARRRWKRAGSRRRWLPPLLAGLVTAVLVAGAWWMSTSPTFRVAKVVSPQVVELENLDGTRPFKDPVHVPELIDRPRTSPLTLVDEPGTRSMADALEDAQAPRL